MDNITKQEKCLLYQAGDADSKQAVSICRLVEAPR